MVRNMIPFQFRKNRIFGIAVFVSFCLILFFVHEIFRRDSALAKLENQLSTYQNHGVHRQLASAAGYQDNFYFNDDDMIVIYNRVPKTASTSFAGIAYELCYKNKFNVIHINTTKNTHMMNIQDQMRFIQNITEWEDKKPAIYHGHFYFIDFVKLGYNNQKTPVYINIVRRPLDRLLSYYYFVRYGDNYRPYLRRRKQGNKMTFDECIEQGHPDCDPVNLWLQIPFFCGHAYRCRQPGSKWALEQAKYNLVNHYLMVGVTEQLADFIAMLEVILPRFFRGAMDLYLNGQNSHLRQTIKKESPSERSIARIQDSTIWKMENEFYEFALEHFMFQKRLSFQPLLDQEINNTSVQTFLLTDGKLYTAKTNQFHYEKIRPR